MINKNQVIILLVYSLSILSGCSDSETTPTALSCVVCVAQEDDTLPPYVDCGSAAQSEFSEICQASDGNAPMCESISSCCERAPLGSSGCAVEVPEANETVPIVNQSLSAVPGDVVFSGTYEAETHIFSADRVNEEIFQLTRNADEYRSVSVGPDRRFFLYSKLDSMNRSSVWLYDMNRHTSKAISPSECDAGSSGLGWFNDTFVGFAMKCEGDEFRQGYLANIYDDNERSFLRQLTNHTGDVVEVYPILNSTFFVYALVSPPCNEDGCMTTSTIWMGDNEITEQQCAITQPVAFDDNPERTITDARKRLGDFRPSIAPDLQSIIFSRVVGAKPEGPMGHHDIWVAETNVRSLLANSDVCAGTPARSLTTAIESDRWISLEGSLSILTEYAPTLSFDPSIEGVSHLFIGANYGQTSDIGLFEAALDGGLTRRTPASIAVIDGTWIQDELNLTGTR